MSNFRFGDISHDTTTEEAARQVRDAIRLKHCAYSTEKTCVYWAKWVILYHDRRRPLEMGEKEIKEFLTYLAVEENVAASTQNQALSALLSLYREVQRKDLDPPLDQGPGLWPASDSGARCQGGKDRVTILPIGSRPQPSAQTVVSTSALSCRFAHCVPYFERILYDNSQLARVYLHAWILNSFRIQAVTGNEFFQTITEGGLDYVVWV